MNRRDLQELSRIRMKEARALLDLRMPDGADYLAGYAVECALKACIAKETKRYDFPDKKRADSSYTHRVSSLVALAGLEDARAAHEKQNEIVRKNWQIVYRWSEESRYKRTSLEVAREMVTAVGDWRYGVISWIRRFW